MIINYLAVKMLFKKKIILKISFCIFIAITVFSFFSCRENIITTENSIGNINEPVKSKSPENYTFEINASKITFNETDETQLNITRADVFVSVTNYSSGIVSVTIVGDNKLDLYSASLTNNGTGQPAKITNHVPEKIRLEFRNFSGNFRIRVTRSN